MLFFVFLTAVPSYYVTFKGNDAQANGGFAPTEV